jgi:hypothetical protein
MLFPSDRRLSTHCSHGRCPGAAIRIAAAGRRHLHRQSETGPLAQATPVSVREPGRVLRVLQLEDRDAIVAFVLQKAGTLAPDDGIPLARSIALEEHSATIPGEGP